MEHLCKIGVKNHKKDEFVFSVASSPKRDFEKVLNIHPHAAVFQKDHIKGIV